MTKNLRLVFGASSLLLLTLAGIQGCTTDDLSGDMGGDGTAGAAGDGSSNAGAGGSVEAEGGATSAGGAGGDESAGTGGAGGASAGAGGEGGAVELTQAELCETFCLDEADTCTGDLSQYADLEECAAKCNQFARGTVGDTSGDTLDCRIYHVNAAKTDADTHCPHIGATPTAGCNPLP